MGKMVDITGKKYGMLTAMYRIENKDSSGGYYWHFKCDCGNECDKNLNSVRTGRTTSCGCKTYKHGDTQNRLYTIWVDMRMRCKKDGKENQKYWGSKGVSVCEEWKDYLNFKNWAMNNGYREDLTIDRIDGNGNYEPINCRWVSYKEQARNCNNNHYVTINGESHLIRDWCDILGTVSESTVYKRVRKYGWDYEKALTTPSLKYSDFWQKKMQDGKNKRSRPFIAFNKNETLRFSTRDEALKKGFCRKGISDALNNKAKCKSNRHYYKGYEWFFADEYEVLIGERE